MRGRHNAQRPEATPVHTDSSDNDELPTTNVTAASHETDSSGAPPLPDMPVWATPATAHLAARYPFAGSPDAAPYAALVELWERAGFRAAPNSIYASMMWAGRAPRGHEVASATGPAPDGQMSSPKQPFIHPSGEIAVVATSKTVAAWHLASATPLFSHPGGAAKVVFASDANVASFLTEHHHDGYTVRRLATGDIIHRLVQPREAACWSPNHGWVALLMRGCVESNDSAVACVDVVSLKPRGDTLQVHEGNVSGGAFFDTSGKLLAVCDARKIATIYSTATWSKQKVVPLPSADSFHVSSCGECVQAGSMRDTPNAASGLRVDRVNDSTVAPLVSMTFDRRWAFDVAEAYDRRVLGWASQPDGKSFDLCVVDWRGDEPVMNRVLTRVQLGTGNPWGIRVCRSWQCAYVRTNRQTHCVRLSDGEVLFTHEQAAGESQCAIPPEHSTAGSRIVAVSTGTGVYTLSG